MHMGVTDGHDRGRPFAHIDAEPEGAISADGRVFGTYMHGIFASNAFRHSFLNGIGDSSLDYDAEVEAALDALAAHLARHLDLDALLPLATEV